MQNQRSNLVYVVSLAGGYPDDSDVSWIDIVYKHSRYFHPVGGSGWPVEPPNYIGFRHGGELRSVHHISGYEVVTNLHAKMPQLSRKHFLNHRPHFLYRLGPAIRPDHRVKNGEIWPSGRVWAMLDLLLTAESVSEARDLTKARLRELS
jgi:hypothetical protein